MIEIGLTLLDASELIFHRNAIGEVKITVGPDLAIEAICRAGADSTQWTGILKQLTEPFRGACAALHLGVSKFIRSAQ